MENQVRENILDVEKNEILNNLLKEAKNGDLDAQNQLIYMYSSLIKNTVKNYYLVGGEREDLEQEARIAFLGAIRDFRSDKNTSFKTFAGLCINRKVMSVVRKYLNQKNRALSDYISISDKNWDYICESDFKEKEDPLEITIYNDNVEVLYSAIGEELSDLERYCLLNTAQGRSYREISDSLNKDKKSVDNALQRARGKLSKVSDGLKNNLN